MEYKTLLLDISDRIANIKLNRPDAANSINLVMAQELMHAVMYCSDHPTIRVVLISGSGRMFCSGGDVKSFAEQADDLHYYLREITTYLHAAISYLARIKTPVVAAVNGFAAGAGMSLACACDLVVAAESAQFSMAYTRAGLTPDGSATYFLPRIVGARRALELVLTNRVLSASEALNWGIVNKIVPDAELLMQACNLATQLAAGPTRAFATVKRLILNSWAETLESQMQHESEAISAMARTADAKEGITAFLEKRAPKFTGQ